VKKAFDKGTAIGFVVGLGAIAGSVVIEGGNLFSYFNVSATLLIFGGCAGIALVAFPLGLVMRVPKLIMLAFKEPKHDDAALVEQFVHRAERARRDGLLALEQEAAGITEPLLKKGIMLVVDGTDPEVVKSVLEIEVVAREARHEVGIGLFEGLGGYAPALGILGTVMGLIRILAHMGKADELAKAIAVAFTATLYGVGSANLFWLPVAGKLKRRSAEEAEHAALVIDGVAALQAGDNPRIVREKLAGYVGPVKAKKGQAAAAPEGAGVPAQAGA